MSNKIKIAIVGDCSNWNQEDLTKKDISSKIINKINKCDIFIFNLEGPIESLDLEGPIESPILKTLLKMFNKLQPIVTSNEKILDILNLCSINVACLANNHIKDGGIKGFKNTLNTINKRKFKYLGAGINRKDASKPLIIKHKNYKVGIQNFNFIGWNKFGLFFNIFGAKKNDYGANYQRKKAIRLKNKKLVD